MSDDPKIDPVPPATPPEAQRGAITGSAEFRKGADYFPASNSATDAAAPQALAGPPDTGGGAMDASSSAGDAGQGSGAAE